MNGRFRSRRLSWPLRALACAALLLTACNGGDAPSEKGGGSAAPETAREYRTGTGKVIIVSETHPVGQSLSTIEVRTEGFEHDGTERYEDRDPVSNVFVADLDGNGFDEIYLVTTSQGSGSYGSVLAFASNRDKSLSTIHFPDAGEGDSDFEGYMGHDVFTVEEGKLLRTFPVYREGDGNSSPSGGTRTLAYGLYPGEASWQLKVEKTDSLDRQ